MADSGKRLIGPVILVFGLYVAGAGVVFWALDRPPGGELALGVCGVVLFLAAYVRVTWDAVMNGRAVALRPLVLLVGGGCAVAMPLWVAGPWGTLPGLFCGMASLCVPSRWAVALGVLVLGAVVLDGVLHQDMAEDIVEFVARSVFTGLAIFALGWLASLQRELWLARGRLAAAEGLAERLAAARAQRDVLGRAVSAIGLRGGLARRLLAEGRVEEAGVQVEAITSLAAGSLVGGNGYRGQSLVAEIEEARAALTAAGVEVDADAVPNGLPEPVHEVLGWVVREAAVQVLRHSEAASWSVRILADGKTVRLQLVNDGAEGTPVDGLGGLAERLRAVDGTLVHGPGPGRTYQVEARVPLA